MTVRRPAPREQADLPAKEKCTYNYKTNDAKIKYTDLVKFSFHFKKESSSVCTGSSKIQGVLFGKTDEKWWTPASLIRLIRTDKEKQLDCE